MQYNLPVEVLASLVVKLLRKQSENRRAMFLGDIEIYVNPLYMLKAICEMVLLIYK